MWVQCNGCEVSSGGCLVRGSGPSALVDACPPQPWGCPPCGLESLIQSNRLNCLRQFQVGDYTLGAQVFVLGAQNRQAIFLLIELSSVSLQQSLLLCTPFECLHVFAQAGLVRRDGINFLLVSLDLGIQVGELVLLRQNLSESV